ncbi:MAG: hypothetical protein BHW64_03240 [Candidatus Melainabacteria bacterium LEY3_CP_29_8]|nr:MAG: hypothetical protein BHW64_03240 [Candidatus Melainabacteria bacterium LEY3_CP_29_8]
MKIRYRNIILAQNDKTIKKNERSKNNPIYESYKPLTLINANQLGIYKSLLNKKDMSFGVKRLNITTRIGQTNAEDMFVRDRKRHLNLLNEQLKLINSYRDEFIKRNNIVIDYCAKYISCEELEDLDTDEKCERYISSQENESDIGNINNILDFCKNKLYEQVDGTYEYLKERLPSTSNEINIVISNLRKCYKDIHSALRNIHSCAKLPKAKELILQEYIQGTLFNELMLHDAYLGIGDQRRQIAEERITLLKVCSYAILSSIDEDTFFNNVKKNNESFNIPPKILNILRGSEIVLSGFDKEEELMKEYYCFLINAIAISTYQDLKIRLLEKHLENVQKIEEEQLKQPIIIDEDLIDNKESNCKKSDKQINKKLRKKKKCKNNSILKELKTLKEVKISEKDEKVYSQQIELKESENTTISENCISNNIQSYIDLNKEFKLIGLSLDNNLEELDDKKLFSEPDIYDEHERYLANRELVSVFYQGLISDNDFDTNISKLINSDKNLYSNQHFVGAFLSRIKQRQSNITLKACIDILKDILNEGVLIHLLTKAYNAKLNIYSSKYKLMIPFEINDGKIYLKTLLDFQDENIRKNKYVSNPHSKKLSTYSTLDTFHNNFISNKNIPTFLFRNLISYGIKPIENLYQKQH